LHRDGCPPPPVYAAWSIGLGLLPVVRENPSAVIPRDPKPAFLRALEFVTIIVEPTRRICIRVRDRAPILESGFTFSRPRGSVRVKE
jgi:hypothetical protein